MEKYKHIKISILLIDISIFLLAVFVVALPFGITWYAEVMGRGPSLATTVMVTFYPCVPFAWGVLLFIRRFLKLVIKGMLFSDQSLILLRNICICCIAIGVITIIAGNFYMPFFFVGATFAFLSLFTFSLRAIIKSELIEETNITENSEN